MSAGTGADCKKIRGAFFMPAYPGKVSRSGTGARRSTDSGRAGSGVFAQANLALASQICGIFATIPDTGLAAPRIHHLTFAPIRTECAGMNQIHS